MDNELFELCKEVYIKHPEHKTWEGQWIIVTENKELKVFVDSEHGEYGAFNFYAPLYTSDYLLEKLPETCNKQELTLWRSGASSWRAGYSPIESYRDDTPLKALLKLTLALHEAGELS